MVRDTVTKQCYRADHVLKGHLTALVEKAETPADVRDEASLALARVDDLDQAGLTEALKKYGVKAPDTGNALTDPAPFNLMFQTSIGPTGDLPGFLRPETAQGIFVNFKRLLECNGGKLPFAAAQVGSAFRNEIAPRSGLLRVREFNLAEIEYFVNPREKVHSGYDAEARAIEVNLLPADLQEKGATEPVRMALGAASDAKIVRNEALAYFMGRTYLFLRTLGIPDQHLRFRQHLPTEMAHYASDCWDAEIRTSYGWIECVGHADRGSYDLTRHTQCSAVNMAVHEAFKDGSRIVERVVAAPKKAVIGKKFRKEAQPILKHFEGLAEADILKARDELAANGQYVAHIDGKEYAITPDMVSFDAVKEKVTGETFIPNVIEPSFGIGRILYCVLEHAFWTRPEDKDRGVLSLPPIVAPIKVSVFPLQNDSVFTPIVARVRKLLTAANVSHKVDETSAVIGKRYARTDEIGIPFAITVDYESVEKDTVTLRERDSMGQVRIPIAEVAQVVAKLADHTLSWDEVQAKYPLHYSKDQ